MCTSLACFAGTGCSTSSNVEAKVVNNKLNLKKLLTETSDDGIRFFANGAEKNSAVSSAASTTDQSSSTNTQVEGIDEGDVIKVDNEYIYKMQDDGFLVAKTFNNGLIDVVFEENIENYVPYEMYNTANDQLIIIGGIYTPIDDGLPRIMSGVYSCIWWPRVMSEVNVKVYDISDKENINKVQDISIDGTYATSRIKDNEFYLVTNYYVYNEEDKEIELPKIDDEVNKVEGEEINLKDTYYFDEHYSNNLMTLNKINLDNLNEEMLTKSYLATYGDNIYVSNNGIYISYTIYDYDVSVMGSIIDYNIDTHIQKFSMDSLENEVSMVVPGTIKDRYSIDEYNGYLRVATTDYDAQYKPSNGMYVYDATGNLTSKIDNLASGETIYSASFNGNLGYIVTFERTDPLYVFDLSNPYDIKVTSELKKDGVSMYLHDYEDGKYMVGVGQNSITEGDRTYLKGIEVALYDISDSNNTVMLDRYIDSRYSYAELLYNPKALLFSKEKNIFGFSVNVNSYESFDDYKTSRTILFNGFYVFRVINDKLEVNVLSNMDKDIVIEYPAEYDESYVNLYKEFDANEIKRGVYIGDYLYTISEKYITSYALSDLQQVEKTLISIEG